MHSATIRSIAADSTFVMKEYAVLSHRGRPHGSLGLGGKTKLNEYGGGICGGVIDQRSAAQIDTWVIRDHLSLAQRDAEQVDLFV